MWRGHLRVSPGRILAPLGGPPFAVNSDKSSGASAVLCSDWEHTVILVYVSLRLKK